MNVTSSTPLTLAITAGVAGALIMPALAGHAPASAVPMARGVHLVTSIQTLSHAPGAFRYAVTVRPVGGPAHAATLVVGTRRPAAWTASAPACLSSQDRTALACDLGDVPESESRTLRLAAKPSAQDHTGVPVIVQAAAANAPSVTSSLGAVRTAAARLARDDGSPADESPSGEVTAGKSAPAADSSGADSPAAESPAVESPAVQSPAVQSPAVQSPAVQSPAVQSPVAGTSPDQSPPIESPSALGGPAQSGSRPPEAESPAVRSHAVRPPGRAPGAPPRIGTPHGPANPHRTGASPKPAGAQPSHAPAGAQPSHAPAREPLPAGPQAPVIPHVPVAPDIPEAGAPLPVPAVPGAPSAMPAVPTPGASTATTLPKIAPQVSSGEGVSELNTVSPAGAMQAGRTSWATMIAVAVVAEAGLLWLIAGVTVWRRKRGRDGGPSLRRRSRRPVISKLLH